jgi:NAD(P)-dependent dehydrogenase (short-subunit alcohol dehydrogenase family)
VRLIAAIKRLAAPHEVAEVIVWLVSDRASLITGIALPADVGLTAGIAPGAITDD